MRREPRPQDLEIIRALKDSNQRKDEQAEDLQSRLVDADMARQQLQGEMQLREENWLANGAMRVGPSSQVQTASLAGQGRPASRIVPPAHDAPCTASGHKPGLQGP